MIQPVTNRLSIAIKASMVAIMLVLSVAANAAYLTNMPHTITQPDKSVVNCLVSGDEFYNWIHDEEGYVIVQDHSNGWFVYATLAAGDIVATRYVVGSVKPADVGLEPNIKPSNQKLAALRSTLFTLPMGTDPQPAPQSGNINNIVIYIRFSDDTEFTDAASSYDTIFNSGAGSMKSYFLETSYNALAINTTFYPIPGGATVVSYKDTHPRAYYLPYDATTNPTGYTSANNASREHTLLVNAVNGVKAQIPGGLIVDADNDGNVDNVCFVVKGATSDWATLLWPHAWALYTQTVTINGKRVWGYNMQFTSWLMPSGVGVLAHEMMHTLGAPDLYHYTNQPVDPVGGWDVMSGSGNPPQYTCAYMKFKYMHWISSLPVISTPGTYTLNPLSSSTGNCYKIAAVGTTTEFYVLEYRRKTGTFENSVPGSGLLVYRINTAVSGNSDGPPDEIYVYRPGGTTTVNGTVNSANYSSTVGRTAINNGTNPAGFLTNGSLGGLNISNVGAAGATISFTVNFKLPNPTISPAGGTFTGPQTVTLAVPGGIGNVYYTTDGTTPDTSDPFVNSGGTIVINSSATLNAKAFHTGYSASDMVSAVFVLTPTYIITASAGSNGTISPTGAISVTQGNNQTFTITPNSGYLISQVTVDSVNQGAIASYTFSNVQAAHTISATFVPLPTYTITATAGANGTISPSGAVSVTQGNNQTFTFTPAYAYVVDQVTIDGGAPVAAGASYTFTNVQAAHSILITFKPAPTVTITASAGANGTISPSGAVAVTQGTNQTFIITGNSGYRVSRVLVDGVNQGAITTYTFTNVTVAHTISAEFISTDFIAFYKFDETSGTSAYDWSGNGYAGTVSGMSTTTGWTAGLINNCLRFGTTANTYAQRVAMPTITGSYTAFTMSMWVYPESASSKYLYYNTGAGTGALQIQIAGTVSARTFLVNIVGNSPASQTTTGVAIPSNAWTLVTFAYDATAKTCAYYVNGALMQTLSYTTAVNPIFTGTTNYVGAQSTTASTAFVGRLDDFRLYSRALIGTEITDIYNTNSPTCAITASAGANGSISPSGAMAVTRGANQTFTITPNTGYTIASVLVDGVDQGTIGAYTFTNVQAIHTISATFTIMTYTITASAGTGGTISPSGAVVVNYGASQTFTISPSFGYDILQVTVDGVNQGALSSYTFNSVQANHTIAATFTASVYTITATAGANGTISPTGAVSVTHGNNQTFTFTPNSGYVVDQVTIDGGAPVAAGASYTFTNVTANGHTIAITFKPAPTVTITASAGANGTISPSGAVPVTQGTNQTFAITANSGYRVSRVLVDGASMGAITTYTFTNVTVTHTISAEFISTDFIAFYKFDESSGTSAYDWSGNGYTGTTSAMTTTSGWTSGLIDNCLQFGTTANVYAQRVTMPTITGSYTGFTMSMWVYPESTSGKYLYYNTGTGDGALRILISGTEASRTFYVKITGNTTAAQTTTGVPVPSNAWTLVTFAYDAAAKTCAYYVNGALTQTLSYTTAVNPTFTGTTNYIGAQTTTASTAFIGRLPAL